LRKVFSAAPIIFKGSGYYVTDSRKKPADTASEKPAAAGSSSDGSSDAKGATDGSEKSPGKSSASSLSEAASA